MNFVPTTQKASLRTGGYSQFVHLTTQFGNTILMFEKDLKHFYFGLLDCGEEPNKPKLYNRDSTKETNEKS